MYEIITKNLSKNKIITLFGIVISLVILISFALKNEKEETRNLEVYKKFSETYQLSFH